MSDAGPFENPLIPNARLRQMYLAMLRARRLEESLPPKQRAWTAGLEACLVAPAIGLDSGDLIVDAISGPVIRFLRGATLESIMSPGKRGRRPALRSQAGDASSLPAPAGSADRLWAAVGAAAGLNATMPAGEASGIRERNRAVAVIYLKSGDGSPASLRNIFGYAAEHLLPTVFVLMPASGRPAASASAKAASACGIPAMGVDQNDAVALYRVAQESIGRGRAGGGPAMIECVPYFLTSGRTRGKTADPIRVIEQYILDRALVTPEWIARETRGLASRLRRPVH
jgi:TPP-dependent pyruvate/acetoin dehydrogenase alpha subunit